MQVQGHEVDVDIELIEFWDSNELSNGGMRIHWGGNIGFGQLDIWVAKDGKLKADTESMSDSNDKEFVKLILNKLADNLDVIG
jgi:hypothetical protein